MQQKWLANKPAERGRPLWGFCRVQVETVCSLWAAYKVGTLRRYDLQTWFAAHELLMRRCTLEKGRRPRFRVAELESITRLPAAKIRASIRRLEDVGLLAWSEQKIVVGSGNKLREVPGLPAMLAAVTNNRRTLPIPRHTVLLLARSRRPVLIATILGHLMRCMYYRNRECFSWGTCKASWIVRTFGVDLRNVKSARNELKRVGWIRQMNSQHWHRQRYGGSFVISLAWDSRLVTRISPPRRRVYVSKSPPPESHRDLPSGLNHQKREQARRSGVERQDRKPCLLHVVPADLEDARRMSVLCQEAVQAGYVPDTPAGRLEFHGAGERARRLGSTNSCGFFATLVRRRLWRNISQQDEDAARRKLCSHPELLYGETKSAFSSNPVGRTMRQPCGTEPSSDRTTIRELVRASLATVQTRYPVWSLTQNHPSDLVEDRISAGRSGVKVEPSEKRLRVIAE